MTQMTLFKEIETDNHIAESYTDIYAMHKYWSKKPYNIIRDFILRYTKEGELILDPFCGSGIAIVESILSRRKSIGIDINPIAVFITKQMLNKVSTKHLENEFKNLEKECKGKIDNLYVVKRNGKEFTGTHFLWNNGNLTEIWYTTGQTRAKKIIEKPTDEDIKLASSFSYDKIPFYYPKRNFFQNSRINAKRQSKLYELFTPRNLYALSFLLDRIEKVKDENIREILKFCFTSCVGQASKMVFVVKKRGKFNGKSRQQERKEVGSWVIGYWVPKENFEINVWNCFENRYRKILKAKRKQENLNYQVEEADNFNDLVNSQENLLLINDSAVSALQHIPDNSIDYIITDPPHGNRMPYLEQSMLWNEWLKKDVNYEDEIVISESTDRKKDITNYYFLLNQVLKNIERVLKPGRYFSLIFNSLDDDTWLRLIKYINELNFELKKIETLEYSAASVIQDNRMGGLKTDFIFTFRKEPFKTQKHIELLTGKNYESFILQKIDKYLEQNKKGLETYKILNYLVIDLLKNNQFFKLSKVLSIIKDNYEKVGNKWVTRKFISGHKERI